MRYLTLLMIFLTLVFACGDKSTEPKVKSPSLSLTPESIEMNVGESTHVQLNIKNLKQAIFGISMRIDYLPYLVSFDDSQDFSVGNYFGQEIISFIKTNSSSIYLTISLVQGQNAKGGSGYLGEFVFKAMKKGSGYIEIAPDEVYFYDATGNSISIPDMVINDAVVSIQ